MSLRPYITGFIAVLLTSSVLSAGCGGGSSPTSPPSPPTPPTPPPTPPAVANVVLNPTSAELVVGGTQLFTATARTSGGATVSGVNFTWTSSNTAVVSIAATGLARGVSAGTATVRATGNGIASAPAAITVTLPPVANVSVSPSAAQEMTVGDTLSFTATARAANGTERDDVSITWTSSDTGVVSITSAGAATAVSSGMATIQAAAEGVSSSPVAITVVEPPSPPPMVATVTVSPPMAEIEEGKTQQFEAMAMTDDGMAIPDAMITWMSSDGGVATIDADGLATGVSAGEATITATADGVFGTAMLTVTEPPPPPMITVVMVSPAEASIEEGQEQQFEAVAMTDDGTVIADAEFAWMSSDENTATVSSMGLATGVSAGVVMIAATAGEVSGSAMLTVTVPPPPVVATVLVSPMEASIEEGQAQQFEAMAMTADGMAIPDVAIMWSSSDDGVATVDADGLAAGVSAGEVTITATVDGILGTATLTVMEPPPVVTTVTVTPPMAEIEEGKTQQFFAVAADADGMLIQGAPVTWTSSDESVATVSSTGLATGVGPGEATITATSAGVTGEATLTVTEAPPVLAKIEVNPPMAEIEEGQTEQFTARGLTSDNEEIPDLDFAWSSSNTNVATVDADGLATAVNAGTAQIRAMAEGITGSSSLTVALVMLRSRTGTFSSRSYPAASGSVTFSEVAGGKLKLEVTGLNDGGGPDVFLLLHTGPQLFWRTGDPPAGARLFGEITNQPSFSETFTPAEGEDIDSYSHAILHCKSFNVVIAATPLSN